MAVRLARRAFCTNVYSFPLESQRISENLERELELEKLKSQIAKAKKDKAELVVHLEKVRQKTNNLKTRFQSKIDLLFEEWRQLNLESLKLANTLNSREVIEMFVTKGRQFLPEEKRELSIKEALSEIFKQDKEFKNCIISKLGPYVTEVDIVSKMESLYFSQNIVHHLLPREGKVTLIIEECDLEQEEILRYMCASVGLEATFIKAKDVEEVSIDFLFDLEEGEVAPL